MTKIVGITGGIGSGKTTFSNHLKQLGFLVHESDKVVSEIYTKPKKKFLSFIISSSLAFTESLASIEALTALTAVLTTDLCACLSLYV